MATRSMIFMPIAQQLSTDGSVDIMTQTGISERMDLAVIKVFGVLTIIVSIGTWLMFVGWILTPEMGGLGARDKHNIAPYFKLIPSL